MKDPHIHLKLLIQIKPTSCCSPRGFYFPCFCLLARTNEERRIFFPLQDRIFNWLVQLHGTVALRKCPHCSGTGRNVGAALCPGTATGTELGALGASSIPEDEQQLPAAVPWAPQRTMKQIISLIIYQGLLPQSINLFGCLLEAWLSALLGSSTCIWNMFYCSY